MYCNTQNWKGQRHCKYAPSYCWFYGFKTFKKHPNIAKIWKIHYDPKAIDTEDEKLAQSHAIEYNIVAIANK